VYPKALGEKSLFYERSEAELSIMNGLKKSLDVMFYYLHLLQRHFTVTKIYYKALIIPGAT